METSASETAGKPIKCSAAVCRRAGEPLVMVEIQVDPPKAWEVRIKIVRTSICHTDITFWKMDSGPFAVFPRILGHEAVGVVESMSEKVEEVKVGDTVLPVFRSNYEKCRDCESPKRNTCSIFGKRPLSLEMLRDKTTSEWLRWFHSAKTSGMTGEKSLGIGSSSFPHPEAIDSKTGVGGAWKVTDIEQGSSVVIFGLGVVGLAVAEGARLSGASKIIGADLNTDQFETAKKFGVIDFVNPEACGEKPISEVIKRITDGGADYSFECIGLASVMTDAFNSSREGGGKKLILGVEMRGGPLSLGSYEILRGRTVVGSFFGGLKPKSNLPLLAQKYLDQELNLDGFITQEVSFQDIDQALDFLLQGKSLRCIIWMDR